jgi:hypothetical protein
MQGVGAHHAPQEKGQPMAHPYNLALVRELTKLVNKHGIREVVQHLEEAARLKAEQFSENSLNFDNHAVRLWEGVVRELRTCDERLWTGLRIRH